MLFVQPRWLTRVGLSVRRLVGPGVGEADDGFKEGKALGLGVGACVGTPEGACCRGNIDCDETHPCSEEAGQSCRGPTVEGVQVGMLDGDRDGATAGPMVGLKDGPRLGLSVGRTLPSATRGVTAWS
jgi:hypothetical protein